jgi:hypothetical protein
MDLVKAGSVSEFVIQNGSDLSVTVTLAEPA